MKKFVLMLFVSVFGLTAVSAATFLPDCFNWKQIICDITDKNHKPKGRSAVYVPELYQSEEYLSVQSEYANYANAYIAITNQEDETLKENFIQMVAGGENLYYIGDLESGMYEVTVEFEDLKMFAKIWI